MTSAIRQAGPKDLETLTGLHRESQEWLAAKGSDQWQPTQTGRMSFDYVRSGIARAIAKGACFVMAEGEEVIATITVDTFADPEFWTDADGPGDALYVHRMIVRRSHAGGSLGRRCPTEVPGRFSSGL